MPEDRELEKQLKLVSKTGKFVVGRREVMSGLKGSKLLVWSNSANLPQSLLDESKNLSIPSVKFNGNPVELGRACGIPFRVSVIAVKSTGDADITSFSSAADYASSAPSVVTVVEELAKKEVEEKAPKKKKATSEESEKAPAKTSKKKVAEKETESTTAEKPKKKSSKPKKSEES